MTTKRVNTEDRRKAESHREEGIAAYQEWEITRAIECFGAAATLVPNEPAYHLHLAQALSRSGDFDQALRALADFIRLKPDSPLTNRFQSLFGAGMDEVETLLTNKMAEAGIPIEEIGAAIHLWVEYRIALGSEPLIVQQPAAWAAAIDYTVRKVNLRPVKRRDIAEFYGVSEQAVKDHHQHLVDSLDVMPCDYRYFTSDENPLDKLVEAAELLERLEARFQEP
ncbi:MAG TPA: tetratricopeptide repeat protein [Chloroflexi bacterium]|nr:tetratricopeptide repeat protein [Chloroflexota bacterium]